MTNPPCSKLTIFIPHPSDRLTNCKPDGDGLVAFGFIQHLAQRGHTLHVVVNDVDIQGDLPANVHLYPANCNQVPAPLRRLLYVIRVRQIFNQIQQESPIDIIHQLNPVVAGLSLSLLGIKCPVVLGPIVADWAFKVEYPLSMLLSQTLPHHLKKLIGRQLFTLQQMQASALLVATPQALQRLTPAYRTAAKTHDLRHGVDAQRFSPHPSASSQDLSAPKILFLGQIHYHKGIFTLLDAFATVASHHPTCELLLAGPYGSQIDQVKAQIAAMRCQNRIKLLGPIQRVDVPHLMNDCTLYCMPSYGEAFGMGALEAMACGKPVVGTDAGGLRYVIPDAGGRKVPPGDAPALAQALLEILNSPELQTSMGQHNREVVETVYRWERVAEQLEAIYYQSLGYIALPNPTPMKDEASVVMENLDCAGQSTQ